MGCTARMQLSLHCWPQHAKMLNALQVGGESVKVGMPNASQITDVAKQFIPLRRLGSPEEAAGSMLMLTCPFSSYISGQILEVTGGGMI